MVTFELAYEDYCSRYSSIAYTRTLVCEQFTRDFVSVGNFSVTAQEYDVEEFGQKFEYFNLLIQSAVRNVVMSYLCYRREIDNLVFDIIYVTHDCIRIYVLDLDSGKTHGDLYRDCSSIEEASGLLSRCGIIGVIFPIGPEEKPPRIILVALFFYHDIIKIYGLVY